MGNDGGWDRVTNYALILWWEGNLNSHDVVKIQLDSFLYLIPDNGDFMVFKKEIGINLWVRWLMNLLLKVASQMTIKEIKIKISSKLTQNCLFTKSYTYL